MSYCPRNNGFDIPCLGLCTCPESLIMPTHTMQYGRERDRYFSLQFKNKPAVVTTQHNGTGMRFEDEIFVRAPKRVEHGDWKTQSVRKEFMGLMEGECGTVVGVFDNMEGRFVTIERADGKNVDCRPSELEVIDKTAFEFYKLPQKFVYQTNHIALSEFEYPLPIAIGHEFEVELAPGVAPVRLRVTEMRHVIRVPSKDKYVPIRVHLTVEQF